MGKIKESIHADPSRAFMTVIGTAWFLIGLTWLTMPSRSRSLGLEWSPIFTQTGFGLVLIVCGLTPLVLSVFNAYRRLGFALLQFAPLMMAFTFGVSAFLGFFPDHVFIGGRPESLTSCISYLAFWATCALMAQVPPEGVKNE